jgi:tRNA dimethylallyltransferase
LAAEEDLRKQVIALVGPTASGKTALSLAIAERLNAEIVACDSRTIYTYMDVGTAKPSPDEQARVRHFMLDVVLPDQTYTAVQYAAEASKAIDDIHSRGKLPIVCGGTGFYARVLLEGMDIPAIPPQAELRDSLKELADERGNEYLHTQLTELDPLSASRININDRFRIIRALEVTMTSGRKFSEIIGRVSEPYSTVWIGLNTADRAVLHSIIRDRLNQQMQNGMVEETESLLQKFGRTQTIMNTVNYKELVRFLDGEIDRAQAQEECEIHNRQLARRQLMWFRRNPRIQWFFIDQSSTKDLHEHVVEYTQRRLIH